MAVIYLLCSVGWEFCHPLFASRSKESAENKLKELKNTDQKIAKIIKNIDPLLDYWEKNNPQPDIKDDLYDQKYKDLYAAQEAFVLSLIEDYHLSDKEKEAVLNHDIGKNYEIYQVDSDII